jgi:predicted O-linked N-acetylglucosamine transferase (SPINDLY family)
MMTVPETLGIALQHHQAGRLPEAEALYRQILQVQPNHSDALHLLGRIAHQVGQLEAAATYIIQAIMCNPQAATFHNSLGQVYRAQGKLTEAMVQYQDALRLNPEFAEAYNNLGNTLKEQRRLQEAVTAYRQAIVFQPGFAEAHSNLGVAVQEQGHLEEAIVCFQKALALRPDFADAHNNLGVALAEQGKLEEAEAHYRQAVALRPAYPEAHYNLGNLLTKLGKFEMIVAHYRQAVALRPRYAEAYFNLGAALQNQGKPQEAMINYERASAIRPTDGLKVRIATVLPIICESKDHLLAARRGFEDRVTRLLTERLSIGDPSAEVGGTNFYLAYHAQNDRDLQMKIAHLYERACPSLLFTAPHCAVPGRKARAGKIKVGFISHFLMDHSIGKITRGILTHLCREKFLVYAIFVPPVTNDATSRLLQREADTSVFLTTNLAAARHQIAAEELDILFYPEIGMDPFTYFLAFSRLAPVQCVSFGHPVTTGIRNMDYFVSTENFEPDNGDDHYSERLVRLKTPIAYYYKPAIPSPLKSRDEFGFRDSEHLYICPQTLFKFHPDFDEILSRILDADSKARLVIKQSNVPEWTGLLMRRFRQTIPRSEHRITVLPWLSRYDFIGLMAVSDVMLDPIHFGGYTTTLEAFAVGIPVVTWPGEFQRGRHTQALYREMGLLECVAQSPDHYTEIAVRLATDSAFRESIKEKILARNYLLFENSDVLREYERFFVNAMAEVDRPVL